MSRNTQYTISLQEIDLQSIQTTGGKAAALGEILHTIPELKIPKGFVITTDAFDVFIKEGDLRKKIQAHLSQISNDDAISLKYHSQRIRNLVEETEIPNPLKNSILMAYTQLCSTQAPGNIAIAVRSSSTAEDLPFASFAGMHDSFLHVSDPQGLLDAYRQCCASLYTERAILYREENGFEEQQSAQMAVLVQEMVSSDVGCAGVAFTVDTETGFENGIVINSVYGLGEGLVQGHIIPDEYLLFKPALEKGNYPILDHTLGAKSMKYVWLK